MSCYLVDNAFMKLDAFQGRRTPHAKVKYDLSLQTPGTDESRPLVMAVAQPSMSSPNEEDEDSATVSLLNRSV